MLTDSRSLDAGVSLIVATRDRPEQLRRLLVSLSNQTYRAFEVLVVDQSNAMRRSVTRQVCEQAARDLQMTYIPCDGEGLSIARNIALQYPLRPIVGFPDDDCWYERHLISRVVEWFAEHPSYGFLQGVYTEPGITNYRLGVRPREITLWRPRARSVGLFIRRASLQAVAARFDEHIGAGTELPASEELDLVLTLLARGIRGRFEPDLVVYHRISRQEDNQAALQRIRARSYVFAKHARQGQLPVAARSILRLVKYAMKATLDPWGRQQCQAVFSGWFDGWRSVLNGVRR